MAIKNYSIQSNDSYVVPAGPFETNADYLTFVMDPVFKSYQSQYETETLEDGITAAREAYNAALPEQPEASAE